MTRLQTLLEKLFACVSDIDGLLRAESFHLRHSCHHRWRQRF